MNNLQRQPIKMAATERKWAKCPNCGSKVVIIDNSASCEGVWMKCTRGCKQEFELIVADGEQIMPERQNK